MSEARVDDTTPSALGDAALRDHLRAQGLGLTPDEYRRLVRLIERQPSVVETRIFDTMWSEHCSYKSSRPLLGRFPTEGSEVLIGPGEDAGVVHLGTHAGVRYCAVLAHESHNHPSQIMPVEGAATGVGGIVRDVFCMGAEVVGVLDALRFGDPGGPQASRVRNIIGGVVQGIMSYGNALGVPNLGGDIYFDPTFDDNCLVNVVAVGVCDEARITRSRIPEAARDEEYVIVLVGKPTDATGFGGAAFASMTLDADSGGGQKEAVQVPDPFLKRVLFEATEVVFERVAEGGVTIGFKDLGAGGIACATVELASAAGMGVEIDLDQVAVDHSDHPPEVIACAETQERFAIAVPATMAADILHIYNEVFDMPALYPGAGARVVGRVLPEDRYVLLAAGEAVCDLPATVITAGISIERVAESPAAPPPPPAIAEFDAGRVLIDLVATPNGASRAPVFRGYDTEVRGRAVIRSGEADAGVIAPVEGARFGLAVAVDGIPAYGLVDPYLAGAHAAYESMRNVVAVGAEPIALTDCLNFGNPEHADVFGAFGAAIDGIADVARGIGRYRDADEPVPVVSGNVSFYNESTEGRSIAPSPIVSCAGRIADLAHATTARMQAAASRLVLVGARGPELGGAEFWQALDPVTAEARRRAGSLPPIDVERARSELYAVLDLITGGRVLACHDISSGGLLVAIAEMLTGESGAIGLGAELELEALAVPVPTPAVRAAVLFGETPGFVLEIPASASSAASALLDERGVVSYEIGVVTDRPSLVVAGIGAPIDIDLHELARGRAQGLALAMA